MASKLPKPSGLKPPQMRVVRPALEPISDNKVATKSRTNTIPPNRLHRRSVSVTDLRPLALRKKVNNMNAMASAGPSKATITKTAPKRPARSEKDSSEGPTKPKVAKKLPEWDYKGRFKQLSEKHIILQDALKKRDQEIADFASNKEKFKLQKVTLNTVEREFADLTSKYTSLEKLQAEEVLKNTDLKSKLSNLKDVSESREKHLQNLEQKHTELSLKNNELEKLFAEEKFKNEELSLKLSALTEKHENLSKDHNELVETHRTLKQQYQKVMEDSSELNANLVGKINEIAKLKQSVANLQEDLGEQHVMRRMLHNLVQDLKGNIRVFCRVRPPLEDEHSRMLCYLNYVDENTLEIKKTSETMNQISGKLTETKAEFTFDKVFAPDSSQQEVFKDLSELVQSALDGYNVCVFAYGQTGSGKTFTMQGNEQPPHKRGLIPRTVDLIFNSIQHLERSGWTYTVKASFLEIYNENIRDLLNINSSQKCIIFHNEGKGTTVTNLIVQPISSPEELKSYLTEAQKNRATAATDFNEHSSRSHAVTKIHLQGTTKEGTTVYSGSINLVDLAGSESAKTSSNERLTETKSINKSLATLGDVMLALYTKSKHVPYRNSKLTYLLQSSLGGNSKTLMVVNIAPFEECYGESLNSLRFASKVKEVKIGLRRNKTVMAPPPLSQTLGNLS